MSIKTGCSLLDFGQPLRKNGKRLPCEVMHDENAKLRELASGMYALLETLDKVLGNHDLCETPRPLIFGDDKSFKDVATELGIEVPDGS